PHLAMECEYRRVVCSNLGQRRRRSCRWLLELARLAALSSRPVVFLVEINDGHGRTRPCEKRCQPAVKQVPLLHKGKAGERDHASGGAVLEKQIGYFDWTIIGIHDVGLDLRPQAVALADAKPFQRLLGGKFYVNCDLSGELYGVIHE